MYIILTSNQYTSAMAALQNSFILKLGVRSLLISLLFTLILGLLAIWIITRNFNKIITAVNGFKDGNHSVRIKMKAGGELANVADTFNSMDETIEQNIIQLKSVEELQKDGVLVKITDTGKGIAEDELPYIFTRYYKGNKTKGANSTGLSLAIVKKILDLHKSSIEVYSKINQGTRFEFKLPLYGVA